MQHDETGGALSEAARAKINLALHVTGRRGDGYHLLDSLVVFPDIADRLSLEPATVSELRLEGPFASMLEGPAQENLVLKAIHRFAETSGTSPDVRLTLEKNLPVASGIGGGSADAAAALRLMERFTRRSLPRQQRLHLALALGADVPVCLLQKPARMSGIGDLLTPAPAMPPAGIVLVNPMEAVSTPAVFKTMTKRDNPPLPNLPEDFPDLAGLCGYLEQTRNDMQAAAEALCPAIADVIATLSALPDVLFARMSGSGATCFALCAPGKESGIAEAVASRHPDWWIASGRL
ncbi:4-(cytidine 5'-diphospho)-2-C-methyl-D-erythritol kinase [uncultured Roseibium sp.]|uniref:4-(cytidine 5'-diphospho)-2-C-methyl-D-erythritol kinase n=1 Tax=uncultured Roseibium sp. TaxID=1936171 RepID=UPI0032167996